MIEMIVQKKTKSYYKNISNDRVHLSEIWEKLCYRNQSPAKTFNVGWKQQIDEICSSRENSIRQ